MKDYLRLMASAMVLITTSIPIQAHAEAKPLPAPSVSSGTTDMGMSTDPKIQQLLKQEAEKIASDFPYRINLFTQGQVVQNSAGVRISETAKQLLANDTGLIFYYELVTNAMRVPHWHSNATETGTVFNGKMRVTIWEGSGETKRFTVEKNGTWIIPKAKLHALENVGKDELKFLVAYDSPITTDIQFLQAWASLPDALLGRAVGLSENDVASIKKMTNDERLSSFDPAATPEKADVHSALSNSFLTLKPLYQSPLGSITRIDPKINPHMKAMAFQRTIMKPNALRTPHWYTSGDVLLFVYNGHAFFTMIDSDGKVYHTVLQRGDVVSVPIGTFHSFLNIGKGDLELYEVFNRVEDIKEISLMDGVQHFSAGVIEGATGVSKALVDKMTKEKIDPYMVSF